MKLIKRYYVNNKIIKNGSRQDNLPREIEEEGFKLLSHFYSVAQDAPRGDKV